LPLPSAVTEAVDKFCALKAPKVRSASTRALTGLRAQEFGNIEGSNPFSICDTSRRAYRGPLWIAALNNLGHRAESKVMSLSDAPKPTAHSKPKIWRGTDVTSADYVAC
jgi:hypothetical protein